MKTKEEADRYRGQLLNDKLANFYDSIVQYANFIPDTHEKDFKVLVRSKLNGAFRYGQNQDSYTESDLVSFGNFLLADRGEGNYLMSKKYVTHADLENWKNEKK